MLRYVPRSKSTATALAAYTQTAIDVRACAVRLWEAVIAAGAPHPCDQDGPWEGGPDNWVSLDRHRARVRAAAAGFPTQEVKAAERAYQRAFTVCVKKNMGLVYKLAGRRVQRGRIKGLEQEDLIQEGVLGMQRALETYTNERGVAFSTYAYFWICQTIDRAIANAGTIRVPIRTQDLASRGKKSGKLGDRAREAGRVASLDEPLPGSGGQGSAASDLVTLMDLTAHSGPSPEDNFMQVEDHASLQKILSTLTEKEMAVVEGRYVEERTLEDVGASMGLTRERIRQIEAGVLGKLRHFCSFGRVGFNG